MKILKRILSILAALVLVLVIGALLYLNNMKTRALPDYNQDVELEGLSAEVEVFRDSLGIPHVYAKNEEDLYRSVGYIMAQDRLWQMDLLRRLTLGRLSEVLGADLIQADKLFRSLDFSRKSAWVLAETDPEMLRCIDAFCDGVNQFISDAGKKLPFEFGLLGYQPDPWEPVHTANLIGYMAWNLSSGWSTEMTLYKMGRVLDSLHFAEVMPDLSLQEVAVYPEFQGKELELISYMDEAIDFVEESGLRVFRGSNNWAVSGERSKTGQPLMSNDMHLGLNAPGIWYQMHQVVEDKMNVSGVVLPGSPYIIAGHNEDIGWGMTNVTVDDLDFYLESIHPADSNQYMVDGQWQQMDLVEEEIWVKGEKEPLVWTRRSTHRGPVVSSFRGIKDQVISASWQGQSFSNELRTVHLLNRAGNWHEFRDAVSTFSSVSQNIVYADRFGNIGLQCSAGVPIREGAGILVYPGDTSLYDWQGVVPFEELPYSFNPEIGYVSSANNRTLGDDYPYYIGTWFSLPYRIGRIREMLDAREQHGIEDFQAMLRDQQSHFAAIMTPIYLEALGERKALEYLENWDYELGVESVAAMIFEWMWIGLQQSIMADELGEVLMQQVMGSSIAKNLVNSIRIKGDSPWCDDKDTPDKTESFADNIRSAYAFTLDTLESLYGSDPELWQWGRLHKLSFEHPLGSVSIIDRLFKINRGPFDVGGSFHTVCPYSYPVGSSFIANHGASERHIFSTADWDASLTVIPTGNSGIPSSPYYMNQTGDYVNNRYHREFFSRKAVEANFLYKATFR